MKKLLSIFIIAIATLCLAIALPACKREAPKEEAPKEEPFTYGLVSEDKYEGNQTQKSVLTNTPILHIGVVSYFFVDYKMPVGEDSETYTIKITVSPVQTVRARIEYAGSKYSEETVEDKSVMTANFTPYDKERDVRVIVMLTPTQRGNITLKGEVLHNGRATENYFTTTKSVYELLAKNEGLNYKLNEDKKSYSVSGIGKEKGDYIYVPEVYEGLPVTGIADKAFKDCTALEINIPGSVTSIGDEAFYNCSKISSMVIPESVEQIGEGAFINCASLKDIKVNQNNAHFKTADGALYTIDGTRLINYIPTTPQTSFAIPEGVKKIDKYVFEKSAELESITIPDSMKDIGDYAFRDCGSLTNIIIPDSVISIGKDAFSGCTSLKSITLPFAGATKDGTKNTHFGYIFGASSYSDNSKCVPETLKSVTINGGEVIDENAFYGCGSLISVTISESVTSIGVNAFYKCPIESAIIPAVAAQYINNKSLKDVTITSGDIGERAFYNCSSLESVTILDSVTSIGSSAFQNCSSLTSITIPNSVTSIGKGAFSGCSSLESITLPFIGATKDGTTNTHFSYIFDTSIPQSLKNVIVTGGKSINSSAFSGCSSLTSITIPDSVISIGREAFFGCSSLKNINIPDSVTSIGENAFSYCSSLESVTIPDSVTSIGKEAFSGCSSLIYKEYNNAKYLGDSENPYVALINVKASWIIACTINPNTKVIADSAFRNCGSITSITIPDSVISIGKEAFSGCSSITSITIPNSVTSIGYEAFYNCSSLTSITFDGTKEQWNAISKGDGWNYLTGKYTIHCTDDDITK